MWHHRRGPGGLGKYMQAKRELMVASEEWAVAQRELDASIGIELDEGPDAAKLQAVNLPRFRAAVIAERAARLRYAKALEASGKPDPRRLTLGRSRQRLTHRGHPPPPCAGWGVCCVGTAGNPKERPRATAQPWTDVAVPKTR